MCRTLYLVAVQSINAEETQEGLCPSPGSVGLWHSLFASPGPHGWQWYYLLPLLPYESKTCSKSTRCLLCVHPHQVSSLHFHPTRFHSISFIILLVAVAALSPAVVWGIQGSGEVNLEENWAELGDWGTGRLGHVALLRGHLSSPWLLQWRMDCGWVLKCHGSKCSLWKVSSLPL